VSSRAATRSLLCHGLIGVEQLRRRVTRIDRRGHVALPRANNHVARDLRRPAATNYYLMRATE
jgi:hypothetical protein